MPAYFPRPFLSMLTLSFAAHAMAADIHVPVDQPTIQAAIDSAVHGDSVLVADGLYTGAANRDLDFNGKSITVKSVNGPAACIIDCQSLGRAAYFHNGESTASVLEGFTIINGAATPAGAILCESASPTIRNCVMAGNASTFDGGAMHITSGQPTITGCTFVNNTADNAGGAILNDAGAVPKITSCRFTGNFADVRGGGAIYNNRSSSPTIVNCEFSGNTTNAKGAAMYTENGLASIINCTFYANHAVQDGGAVLVTNGGVASLSNCIFWANTPNQITTDPGTALVQYCDVQGGFAGTGNINADPMFISPAAFDLKLQTISPCVDAGSNSALPSGLTTDIDGATRLVDVLAAANVGVGVGCCGHGRIGSAKAGVCIGCQRRSPGQRL